MFGNGAGTNGMEAQIIHLTALLKQQKILFRCRALTAFVVAVAGSMTLVIVQFPVVTTTTRTTATTTLASAWFAPRSNVLR